jgi:hypothetical protein
MPIIRKFAVQGHEVPKSSYRPHGPFPPEVLAQTRVVYDQDHGDSLHEALDDVRLFKCKDCGDILTQDELTNHDCEETDTWQ